MSVVKSKANQCMRKLNLNHDDNDKNITGPSNFNKSLPSITTKAFFHGKVFETTLFHDLFNAASTEYAIIFFCDYDFTKQSKGDLLQIHENYSKLLEHSIVPVVVTHDQPEIHHAYATPNCTNDSLEFSPEFILVSDSNRLISTAFGSINVNSNTIQRSTHIINSQCKLMLSLTIPNHKPLLPMEIILSAIDQT
ncbi:unnamed protein product [Rhizopus stolonifer]